MADRTTRILVVIALGALTIGLTAASLTGRPAIFGGESSRAGAGGDRMRGEAAPSEVLLREDVLPDQPLGGADAPALAGSPDPETVRQALKPAYDRLKAGEYAEALWLAEPVAKNGDPEAQHLVGYLYEKGLGAKEDATLAERYYARAAEAGHVNSMIAHGTMLVRRNRSAADLARAASDFRAAAERGDPRGVSRLGALYIEGVGVVRDAIVGMSLLEKAAGMEEPDALYFLGMAHVTGVGKPVDPESARRLLSRAVKAGHVKAAYNLALLYRSKSLGEPDLDLAARLMQASADAGYPPAMTAMGLYAHRGEAPGKPADWFERAAQAGDLQGRFLYAVALAEGDGRPKDVEAARSLAREVAEDPASPRELTDNVALFLKNIAEGRAAPGKGLRESVLRD